MLYVDTLSHNTYTIPDDLLVDYVLPKLDKKYYRPANTHLVYFNKGFSTNLTKCKSCNLHSFFRVKEDDRCYCSGCNGIVEYCICLEVVNVKKKRQEVMLNYVTAENEKASAAKEAIKKQNLLRLAKLGKIGKIGSDVHLKPLPSETDTPADAKLSAKTKLKEQMVKSYFDSFSGTGTIFTDYISYTTSTTE